MTRFWVLGFGFKRGLMMVMACARHILVKTKAEAEKIKQEAFLIKAEV